MKIPNNSIACFRARMKKRGYREIHIRYDKEGGYYKITGIEPLNNTFIHAQWDGEAMLHGFRF